MLKEKYGDYLYKRCQKSLAEETLGNLRGKVVLCCEQGYFHEYDRTWNVPFSKYGGSKENGLVTCGVFKAKVGMKDVHGNAEKALNEHKHHAGDNHLLWIYWQQTGGFTPAPHLFFEIEKNTTKGNDDVKFHGIDNNKGAHANLYGFCHEILQHVRDRRWRMPNVISHDFVTEQTCSEIIALCTALIQPLLPPRPPRPPRPLQQAPIGPNQGGGAQGRLYFPPEPV